MIQESDIAERLREYARNCGGPPEDYLTWQAADEIERLRLDAEQLRAEIEQLRAALRPFTKAYAAPGGDLDKAIQNARAALESKP